MSEPLTLTPSQTVGPFLHIALADPALRFAVVADAPGAIHITGTLTDGGGSPVPDGLIETWQADGLFARCPTDDDGAWHVVVPLAPYLAVHVFARGMLRHLTTRIYLDAAADDPVLAGVPADRRDTLLAERTDDGYRFDIRIQGERETVFFDV